MRRPIVLLATAAFAETLLVLLFPGAFLIIICAVVLILALCIALLIRQKKKFLIIPVAAVTLISLVNPYIAYIRKEKSAEEFLKTLSGTDSQYTATVTQCNVYSSYAQIFADLVSVDGKPTDTKHKVRIACFSRSKLDVGDTIVFTSNPLSLSEIKEDSFDTSTHLRSKQVFIDFPSATLISSSNGDSFSLFDSLRNYSRNTIYRFLPSQTNYDTADVCFAMFAGSRDYLSEQVKNTFSECGLTHLLCVSGLHLAIIVGAIYTILSALSVHKNIRCALVITICVLYTLFTGASLSTVRACIMCCMGFTGMIIGRRTDAYLSLFFSLLLIVTLSPYSVFDISALLSFSATLGIISLSEFCPKYHGKNIFFKALISLLGLVLSNLGAVMFTLPLCAYFFSGISIMSVISTLCVSFIAQILLMALPLLIVISPLANFAVFESIVACLGKICHFLCSVILSVAEFFSDFRYSTVTSVGSTAFLCIFAVFLAVLTISISTDKKVLIRTFVICIVVLGTVFSIISLCTHISNDKIYKVTYYRKNENDRQLSIKLEDNGYLLVNADSLLSTDYKNVPFDTKQGRNSLLIIPDDTIDIPVLADSIKSFDKRFGLECIFLPKTPSGAVLSDSLGSFGITAYFFPETFEKDSVRVNLKAYNAVLISVDDGKVKTDILYSDSYNRNYFHNDCDICAFFTRKSKNQFDTKKDIAPDCDIFITRLKKGENPDGIVNTFGQKSVIIKG